MTAPNQQQQRSSQAQAGQAAVAAIVAADLLRAFPTLDLTDSRSVELFTMMVQAVVATYAPASATLAVQDYQAVRAEAGVRGTFTPVQAAMPTADDVQAAVEWAVRAQIVPAPDPAVLADDLTKSAQKLVQDVGRATVIENVHRDKAATSWARIPEPTRSRTGTCAFCAMLAGRGAVYKADTAKFKAHPGCQCHAEPVFGRYQPSDLVKGYQALYKTHVTDAGRRGANARAAFRQAIEDRPVTGLTRAPNGKRPEPRNAPRKAGKRPEPRSVEPTPEQADRMIALFEQSNARAAGNPKLASMVKANNARIAELRKIIAQPLERV